MPGFSSMDDFVSEVSQNGKFTRVDWNKSFLPTTAALAGEWHCLFRGAGHPGADSIGGTGANLTWQQLSDTTTNATGIQHGGNVSPDYKHIVNASAFTAAALAAPSILMLVDMLGFYRVTTVTTTTAQNTINTLVAFSDFTADPATEIITHTNINLLNLSTVQVSNTGGGLPAGLAAVTNYFVIKITDTTCRLASSYANAVAATAINITTAGTGTQTINTLLPRYTDGAGVQSFIYNPSASAMGAGTPNLSLEYTETTATSARGTPVILPIGKTAGANGLILYSGTGSGKYGPFMPLQGGDRGIRSVETIRNASTYTSGEYSVALCKPLITLPLTTLGVAAERDFMNQIPSLPRVYDGACLVWLMYSALATPVNSSIYGHIDLAFG